VTNPNPEHNPSALLLGAERHRSRLPPHRVSLKKPFGDRSSALMFGSVRELLVMAEDDEARPPAVGQELVDLETDKGILAHPVDFLAQSGIAIQKLAVQVDMYGNDVWLIIVSACETRHLCPL
jgi:hypothetical protein